MPVIVPETETYITTWFCEFQDPKTLLQKVHITRKDNKNNAP